ncbi:MAG: ornithine cyclodeaminase family protein [Candidatus Altiarchaeota archaeon]|nr:ornithine cyclodeaminase family protein [Candidatus Altiarchaeota archaeon]
MLLLKRSDVEGLLPLEDFGKIIDIVEGAFKEYAYGTVQMPPKQYLNFERHEGDLRIMPSYLARADIAGTKIVNVHTRNKGLPTVMAVIVLNDPKTGEPISMMDGTYITSLRTGAAAAIATKYLAKEEGSSLGVVGAGVQSKQQIKAISVVRDLDEILVSDVRDGAVENLAKEMKGLGIAIRKGDLKQVCSNEILSTITPVRTPIVKREWIRAGTHINAIGADAKGKEELDPRILKDAKLVIDDWEQASHSGEINVPLEKGIITREDIYSTLGDIVIGKKKGRTGDEITVFDSTGLSIQDISLANHVYESALKRGIGWEFGVL